MVGSKLFHPMGTHRYIHVQTLQVHIYMYMYTRIASSPGSPLFFNACVCNIEKLGGTFGTMLYNTLCVHVHTTVGVLSSRAADVPYIFYPIIQCLWLFLWLWDIMHGLQYMKKYQHEVHVVYGKS